MIDCRGVSKYFGSLAALDNVTIAAKDGRITGLVGPNAAGKSTLIRLVAGFARPSVGCVSIDGRRPSELRQLPQRLGLLCVDSGLPSQQKVIAHLREIARVVRAPQSELDALIDVLGLGPVVDQQFSRLSLGTRRRVMLALALLPRPKSIVLDEPMNGLDPNSTRALGDFCATECRKMAVACCCRPTWWVNWAALVMTLSCWGRERCSSTVV